MSKYAFLRLVLALVLLAQLQALVTVDGADN